MTFSFTLNSILSLDPKHFFFLAYWEQHSSSPERGSQLGRGTQGSSKTPPCHPLPAGWTPRCHGQNGWPSGTLLKTAFRTQQAENIQYSFFCSKKHSREIGISWVPGSVPSLQRKGISIKFQCFSLNLFQRSNRHLTLILWNDENYSFFIVKTIWDMNFLVAKKMKINKIYFYSLYYQRRRKPPTNILVDFYW